MDIETYGRSMLRGVIGVVFLAGVILSSSCHKALPLPEPGPQYDPRNISRNDTYSVGPSIAVGPDGTVYVVWMDGGHNEYDPSRLYFRYKPSGGEWSEVEILTDTTRDAWAPQIAVDPSNNLHLVWEADHPSHNEWHADIYYLTRSPSGEWSDVEVLSNTGIAEQPRIAVDSSGTVHVIWLEGMGLKHRSKPMGANWDTEEIVPVGRQGAINHWICSDKTGGLHIVYEAGHDIKYLYRSPSGEWSEPVNVSQSPQWMSWIPKVAVNSDGDVWVDWVELGKTGMFYAVKPSQGMWTPPDSVPDVAGYPGTNRILFDNSGNLYFVWEKLDYGVKNDIYYKVHTSSGEWEPEINISNTEDESKAPDFAIGSDGLHVIWEEKENGENYEIYYVFVPF